MKSLLLAAFLMTSVAQAQTIREARTKEVMLARIDTISEKLKLVLKDLKKKDVVNACAKVKEVFVIYPDHVTDIGSRLDPFARRAAEIKNDALNELIMLHSQTLECDRGTGSEYIDPRIMGRNMKDILNSLKKQRRVIRRSNTSFENPFHYEYEF